MPQMYAKMYYVKFLSSVMGIELNFSKECALRAVTLLIHCLFGSLACMYLFNLLYTCIQAHTTSTSEQAMEKQGHCSIYTILGKFGSLLISHE